MSREQLTRDRKQTDIMKLCLAMKSFSDLGGSEKGLDKGLKIVKRYKESYGLMLEKMIVPILEEGLNGLQSSTLLSRLNRASVGEINVDQILEVSESISQIMNWFKSRQQEIRTRFPDEKTRKAWLGISNACLESMIDLNALLQVPRASKASTISKWIVNACESTQQANEVEVALSDMQEVSIIAEEIKAIDTRIRAGGLSDSVQLTLLEERETKFDLLLDMTRNSLNRQALLSEASNILNTNTTFLTQTGERQRLTPEQEEAMMTSGKSIIAAGAGSGKTRVLASKIAYTINELQADPSQIIATTFSKEAAGHLKSKALDVSDGQAKGKYIGSTTHSISFNICNKANVFRGMELMKDAQVKSFISAAIDQVTLLPQNEIDEDSIVGVPFIDTSRASVKEQKIQQTEDRIQDEEDFEADIKELLIRTTRVIAEKALWAKSIGRTGWPDHDLRQLGNIIVRHDGRNVELLSENHSAWDDPGFRAMINDLISTGRGQKSLDRADPGPDFSGRFAAQYANKQDSSVSLNQWFNLGLDRTDLIGLDTNEADYIKYIGIQKARLVSPTQLWSQGERTPFVAVYGAYEYLKKKKKLYDFDDMLLQANKVLIENPRVLRTMNASYKYIFVDEAQDLNHSQHVLFGLIAGHVNPETLKPYGDGRMTAHTYCFIGDDKQAIYEFRGAEPEEFINISDEHGGEFKTSILRTNFRSGRNIVQAANKLIEHNKKQIPMVCNPNPKREEGRISSQGYLETRTPMSPGAIEIAQEIKEIVDVEGWSHKTHHKFGIGCRTNKELRGYAFELLVNGLPYYSKRDLLNSVTMLAPLELMSVRSSDPKTRATALFTGHKHLLFYIDRHFNETVERESIRENTNPLDWFLNGGWSRIYSSSSRKKTKNAEAYADALQSILDFDGSNDELLEFVNTSVRGVDGKTLLERLGKNLSSSEMNDLMDESDAGEVSSKELEEYAESGTEVVRRVMKGKTLEEGISFFMNLKEQSKKMTQKSGDSEEKHSVFLGTMHSWKGLQCRDMYIPMTAGEFPDERSSIDSERRLAYVAMTRGEDRVKIIYGPGKDPKNKYTGGPSQFISEACIRPESSLNIRSASDELSKIDFMFAMEQFLANN